MGQEVALLLPAAPSTAVWPVADDAGAEERSCLHVGKALWDGVGKVLGDHHCLGVATVGVETGELRVRAQVLQPPLAELALARALKKSAASLLVCEWGQVAFFSKSP